MSASMLTRDLMHTLNARGIAADFEQAETLRRAQLTLHRWAELECGDDNGYSSFCIERDEATEKPYMVTYRHDCNKSHRRAIPDREAGALRRVKRVCDELGAHYFHQTDPRGCALYVSKEPLTDSDYNRGVAITGGAK